MKNFFACLLPLLSALSLLLVQMPSPAYASPAGTRCSSTSWAFQLSPAIPQSSLPSLPYARGVFRSVSSTLPRMPRDWRSRRWILSSSPSATGQLRTDDAAQLGLFHRGRRLLSLGLDFNSARSIGVFPKPPLTLPPQLSQGLRPTRFRLVLDDIYPPYASSTAIWLVGLRRTTGVNSCSHPPRKQPYPAGSPHSPQSPFPLSVGFVVPVVAASLAALFLGRHIIRLILSAAFKGALSLLITPPSP